MPVTHDQVVPCIRRLGQLNRESGGVIQLTVQDVLLVRRGPDEGGRFSLHGNVFLGELRGGDQHES
jgi:hypothetical protein